MSLPRQWYSDSRAAIEREYCQDAKLFTGLLAATSANSSLVANLVLARKAYGQIKSYGRVRRESFILAHYSCIQAVLETGLPRGRKVVALCKCLLGDEDNVAVDLWMCRWAGIEPKSLNRRLYDEIEHRVRTEAARLGITPGQRQAEIWCSIRGRADSYADYMRQMKLF